MPRAGDPRLTLRLSRGDLAVLDGAAVSCGVETGALVREAALRAAAGVARDVEEGRLVLRRRRGSASAAKSEQVDLGDPRELASGRRDTSGVVTLGDVAPAHDPGVARAIAFRRATGAL